MLLAKASQRPGPQKFRGSLYLFSPLLPVLPMPAWQFFIFAVLCVLVGTLMVMRTMTPWPGWFAILFVYLHAQPTKITLGLDGIGVSWLLRRTYYPHGEIFRALGTKGAVELTLTGERHVTLASSQARELLDTWRVMMEAPERPRLSPSVVARGGRTAAEWLTHVGALGNALPEAYREHHLREDDLWELLEHPRTPPDARVGAAMGLRRRIDEAGRTRLRLAAASCVLPELAKALDRAADPDATDLDLERAVKVFAR